MKVTGSRRAARLGRAICALLSGVILVGVVACGESSRLSLLVPTPEPTPVIAHSLAMVPPGRIAPPLEPSPTARPADEVPTPLPPTPPPTPTPTPIGTPTPTPTPPPREDLSPGHQVFIAKGCTVCHGEDLSGGIGPALACRTPEDLPEDRIRSQLAEGGNGMPAFSDLTEEEIRQLIEFIRKGSC
ncbi:MAG: cytochrome c [Chloroflexi bacterium]|nr:cytochrome c [Chloroflexota bacterium]